jgi:hypothetical protein
MKGSKPDIRLMDVDIHDESLSFETKESRDDSLLSNIQSS